ncbi:MAG: Lrp/AsnC family transcriptional regulator [Chloroflexia bacterium]
MGQVDRQDVAIVDLLMEDGRMSCAEIARRVGGISERAVRYRIARLVREGVIRVSAIPNPKALGFLVVADVMIEVEPGHIREVAETLRGYECVSYAACSTGDRDVSIQVVARDNAELYRFVTEVVAQVPGVRRTETYLVPIILKDVYEWRIPRECVAPEKGG